MNFVTKPHEARSFPMLESKVALVTGAGSGIGKAGAMAMARHGALVVVTDLDAGKAATVVAELENEGVNATSAGLDVTDDEAVFAEINRVVSKYGRLDVLHSHAGYQIEGNLEDVPVDGMDMSWRLNVRSHFVAARSAVGHMRDQGGGSIIITSSNSGVQYDREMIAYATTKHAVCGNDPPDGSRLRQAQRAFQCAFARALSIRLSMLVSKSRWAVGKSLRGTCHKLSRWGDGARLKK